MNDIVTQRASFWRESLRELMTTLESEAKWVIGFVVVIALAQFLLASGLDVDALSNQLKDAHITSAQRQEIMQKIMTQGIYFGLPLLLIMVISVYTFTTLYLRRMAKSTPPQFGVGHFFFWLGKSIQKYLLLILPPLLLGMVTVLLGALHFPKALVAAVFIAISLFFLMIIFRLSLVTPLAILHRQPVIKKSWEITKGHCWRIWWGAFVQFILYFLVCLIAAILQSIAKMVLGDLGFLSAGIQFLSALINGVLISVFGLAMAVYYCTVLRILLQEQKSTPVLVNPNAKG